MAPLILLIAYIIHDHVHFGLQLVLHHHVILHCLPLSGVFHCFLSKDLFLFLSLDSLSIVSFDIFVHITHISIRIIVVAGAFVR